MSGYLKGDDALLGFCVHLPLRDTLSLFIDLSDGFSPFSDTLAAVSNIIREMSGKECAQWGARIELNRPAPIVVMARAIAFIGGKWPPTVGYWIRRLRSGV